MGIFSEIDLDKRQGYMIAAMDVSNTIAPPPAQSGDPEPKYRIGIDPIMPKTTLSTLNV